MSYLRAGLIGLGMMGRHHARVLASLEGVELVATVDPMGDPHGVAAGLRVLSSVEEALERGLDYAVLAVPTAFHAQVGVRLVDRGAHGVHSVAQRLELVGEHLHRILQAHVVKAVATIQRDLIDLVETVAAR